MELRLWGKHHLAYSPYDRWSRGPNSCTSLPHFSFELSNKPSLKYELFARVSRRECCSLMRCVGTTNEKSARWPVSSALPLLPTLLVLLVVSHELAAKKRKLRNVEWQGQFEFFRVKPVAADFLILLIPGITKYNDEGYGLFTPLLPWR